MYRYRVLDPDKHDWIYTLRVQLDRARKRSVRRTLLRNNAVHGSHLLHASIGRTDIAPLGS